MLSAFGVDHGEISKSDQKPTGRRLAAGAVFPGVHGAVAGKKGKKLRASGYELGGGVVAGPVGSGAGTYLAHQKGYYKRDKHQ